MPLPSFSPLLSPLLPLSLLIKPSTLILNPSLTSTTGIYPNTSLALPLSNHLSLTPFPKSFTVTNGLFPVIFATFSINRTTTFATVIGISVTFASFLFFFFSSFPFVRRPWVSESYTHPTKSLNFTGPSLVTKKAFPAAPSPSPPPTDNKFSAAKQHPSAKFGA